MIQFPLVIMTGSGQYPEPSESEYIPGVCNIGKKEIKKRRNAALFSLALCFLFIGVAYLFGLPKYWRLLMFIPSASFGISFQQWYFKFCVAFGLKGIFNFNEIGKANTIEEKEYLRKDKLQAWKIILSGIALGVVAMLIFFVLL